MNITTFAETFADLVDEYGRNALVTFYIDGQSFGGTKNRVSIDIVDSDTVDDYCVLYFYDTDNGNDLTLGYIADMADEAAYEFVSADLNIYFVDEYGENINSDIFDLKYSINDGANEEEYML